MTGVAFTPIIPKRMNVKIYATTLIKALKAEARLQRRELGKTVRNWSDPPRFETKILTVGKDVVAWTRPVGNKKQVDTWTGVDKGTKPHRISARRAPTLRFQTGYKARTSPKKFRSGRSRRFGPFVTPISVKHPGIKAREWSKTLSEKRENPYNRRMKIAMAWAAIRTFFS
jgi:hypothetical protein